MSSLLISSFQIEKAVGDKLLFTNLSFGIHEKQRVGILGPNGSGKSTLLKILAGLDKADTGEVTPKKQLRLTYVPQEDIFPQGPAIDVATKLLQDSGIDPESATIQASIYLGMAGFEDLQICTSKLSGGWKKRMSLALALAQDPELLLLDEPTNHLDWDGILWLESQLNTYKNALLIISHDREFIKNQCDEFMEVSKAYKDGLFCLKTDYENFLEKRDDHIRSQLSLQESLSNKARREVEWLRAGVKARTTKSQSRIKEAHQLLDDLGELKSRNSSAKAKVNIAIESAGKKSKKLLELDNLHLQFPGKDLIKDLSFTLGPKSCIGILGTNGSGKTSLLKAISGDLVGFSEKIFIADGAQVIYFDQKRDGLNKTQTISEFLGDGSDYVNVRGRSMHVASYASQFLFPSHILNTPIAKLSGGEQARLLIARLLTKPADILILDEPTNDLDTQTIEILEDQINSFDGLCLLVSHDRYFLKSTCQKFLALDGVGGWQFYSDLNQWLRTKDSKKTKIKEPKTADVKPKKVKLSYKDKRFLETVEDEIAAAENDLSIAQKALEDNQRFDDHQHTQGLIDDMNSKQQKLDQLFARWQELEEKK